MPPIKQPKTQLQRSEYDAILQAAGNRADAVAKVMGDFDIVEDPVEEEVADEGSDEGGSETGNAAAEGAESVDEAGEEGVSA